MKLLVKNVRLSFHDLEKAKKFEQDDEYGKFNVTTLASDETTIRLKNADGKVVNTSHRKIDKVIEQVVKEKFNGKVPPKLKNWVYCSADGNHGSREAFVDSDGNYYDGADENTFIISATKREDLLHKIGKSHVDCYDQKRNKIDPKTFYSGCYVNLSIDIYAMKGKKTDSVQASLEAIQFLRDGERLGAAPADTSDDFDEEEMPENEAGDVDLEDEGELDGIA